MLILTLLADGESWLHKLFHSRDAVWAVAQAVVIISMVAVTGLWLGGLKVKGVSLGIAGVLFSGLFFAQWFQISHEVLEFAREFGLMLFVFTVGLQVGPSFISSLRRGGMPLNLLAASIIVMGILTTLGIMYGSRWLGHPIDAPAAAGLLAGGTTNTPSLAAAQQAVQEVLDAKGTATQPGGIESASLPGRGYAVAYPFGVIGIILTMLLVRSAFKVNVAAESEALAKQNLHANALVSINLEVTNPNLDGRRLDEIPQLSEGGVVVSRVLHSGVTYVARGELVLHTGDTILAVGVPEELEKLKLLVGRESRVDVKSQPSGIATRRMVVTRREVIGQTLQEADFLGKYGVTITRTGRAEIEIAAMPGWKLQFGDTLFAVGDAEGLDRVGAEVGDSRKHLDHPHMSAIFLGLGLGVLLGSIPVSLPGMPAPVKLGLAGGPLVAAIVLSRIGQVGPLSWYMPRASNYALREFGIALFLACVGLKAGHGFIDTLKGDGLYWMVCGAAITLVPLLVGALIGRIVMKMNFVTLCGLLAGSMTDPPALQFANQLSGGEAASVAYATVYPLTMLLRVVGAQLLVLLFWQ